MTEIKLDRLAGNIALLSNEDLCRLATILVNDHAARADSLRSFLQWAEFDKREAA